MIVVFIHRHCTQHCDRCPECTRWSVVTGFWLHLVDVGRCSWSPETAPPAGSGCKHLVCHVLVLWLLHSYAQPKTAFLPRYAGSCTADRIDVESEGTYLSTADSSLRLPSNKAHRRPSSLRLCDRQMCACLPTTHVWKLCKASSGFKFDRYRQEKDPASRLIVLTSCWPAALLAATSVAYNLNPTSRWAFGYIWPAF
jgi:hypothetical protein